MKAADYGAYDATRDVVNAIIGKRVILEYWRHAVGEGMRGNDPGKFSTAFSPGGCGLRWEIR